MECSRKRGQENLLEPSHLLEPSRARACYAPYRNWDRSRRGDVGMIPQGNTAGNPKELETPQMLPIWRWSKAVLSTHVEYTPPGQNQLHGSTGIDFKHLIWRVVGSTGYPPKHKLKS